MTALARLLESQRRGPSRFACPAGLTDETAAPILVVLRAAGYVEAPHGHSSLGAVGRAHLDAEQRSTLRIAVDIHDYEWLVVMGLSGGRSIS